MVVGRIQSFVNYWTEGLSSLSCGLLQHGSLLHQSQQGRESASEMEVKIFYNLITEVTSEHIYHILLVRSESLGAHTLMGKGLHMSVNTRRQESLRTILKLACHSGEWILGKDKVEARR